MTRHELKTWPVFFEAVVRGEKTFELRREDDRPARFLVEDRLLLREWKPDERVYTGRQVLVRVTYVLRGPVFGLAAGYIAMGIAPVEVV